MTSSKSESLRTKIFDSERIPVGTLAYFQQRLKNRIHEELVDQFIEARDGRGLTKAELARKLGKKPEQITRWLSVPSNLRLETISDLLLAIGALEPVVECQSAISKPKSNSAHSLAVDWNVDTSASGTFVFSVQPSAESANIVTRRSELSS